MRLDHVLKLLPQPRLQVDAHGRTVGPRVDERGRRVEGLAEGRGLVYRVEHGGDAVRIGALRAKVLRQLAEKRVDAIRHPLKHRGEG